MATNGNGATPGPVDWRSVAISLQNQLAELNLEVTIRGTIIGQLQAALSEATACGCATKGPKTAQQAKS